MPGSDQALPAPDLNKRGNEDKDGVKFVFRASQPGFCELKRRIWIHAQVSGPSRSKNDVTRANTGEQPGQAGCINSLEVLRMISQKTSMNKVDET